MGKTSPSQLGFLIQDGARGTAPFSATRCPIPQSATPQLPPPRGSRAPSFSAVSSWGWGPGQPDWTGYGKSRGAWPRHGDGRTRSGRGPRPLKLQHQRCTRTPREHAPRSLVEQGRLGWADNGGPAGRSRGSSAGHSGGDAGWNPNGPRWDLRWGREGVIIGKHALGSRPGWDGGC